VRDNVGQKTSERQSRSHARPIDDALCSVFASLQWRHGYCYATEAYLRFAVSLLVGHPVGARTVGRATHRLWRAGRISHRRIKPGRPRADGRRLNQGAQHNRYLVRWEARLARRQRKKLAEVARRNAKTHRERLAEIERLMAEQPEPTKAEPPPMFAALTPDQQAELSRLLDARDYAGATQWLARHAPT
jgi:hypothetical protein